MAYSRLIHFLVFLVPIVLFGQNIETNNYFDSSSNCYISEQWSYISKIDKKDGYYVQMIVPDSIIVDSGKYENNLKNGNWKTYFKIFPHTLESFGEYKYNIKIGDWKYFYQGHGKKLKEKFSYLSSEPYANYEEYHPNGMVKAQGKYLLQDSLLKHVGIWKYYEISGKLIKLENYNDYGQKNGKQLFYEPITKRTDSVQMWSNDIYQWTKDMFDFQKTEADSIESVLEKYKITFPNIHKNDIVTVIAELNYTEKTETNYLKNKERISTLIDLDSRLSNVVDADADLNKIYEKVYGNYQSKFMGKFKQTISTLPKQIEDIKEIGSIEEKEKRTSEMIKKLEEYSQNYDTIIANTEYIELHFPEMVSNFENNYPIIHETEISKHINDFINQGNIDILDEKLSIGSKLVLLLKEFESYFTDFQETDKAVNETYPTLRDNYKNNYSKVYREEIKAFDDQIELFQESGTLNSKLEKSKLVKEKIHFLDTSYNVLSEISKDLLEKSTELSGLYKESFPNVFKIEINSLTEKIDEYNDIGNIGRKTEFGNNTLEKMNKLIYIHPDLVKEKEEILSLESKFEEEYNNRKKAANIYRKGKKLYKKYYKAYSDQGVVSKKQTDASNCKVVLNCLLNYAKKDDAFLKFIDDAIRKAKTDQEVESVLGV